MEVPEISGGMAVPYIPMRSLRLFHAELPRLAVWIRMQELFPIQILLKIPNRFREKFSGSKDGGGGRSLWRGGFTYVEFLQLISGVLRARFRGIGGGRRCRRGGGIVLILRCGSSFGFVLLLLFFGGAFGTCSVICSGFVSSFGYKGCKQKVNINK